MRVPQFLTDHEVVFETMVHPPAYTADRRCRLLHIPGKEMAKCVLLAGSHGYLLAVLPATHQIDLAALEPLLEGPVRLATSDEIACIFRDCEWGTLAPFGSLYDVPTILDTAFEPDSVMVFEAQRHATTIRMRCRDYERLERPRRLHFANRRLNTPHFAQAQTAAGSRGYSE